MHNLADVDDGGEDNDDDNDDRYDENDNEEDDDGFFLKLLNCLHSQLLRSLFFFHFT